MHKLISLVTGFALACVIRSAGAQSPPITAQDAWIRVTPGSDVAAAYLTLRNTSKRTVTLVAVASSAASMAMIHETKVESGVSRMRPHEQLAIAPGQTVKLEPGGLHIMLHGIATSLLPGTSVPLLLTLSDGSAVQIVALVRPLNAQ